MLAAQRRDQDDCNEQAGTDRGEGDRAPLARSADKARSKRKRAERLVVAQDCLLELAQSRPRLESELVAQPAVRGAIGPERFCLASRAVEREHQLLGEPLPRGMRLAQLLKLADHRRSFA
jgi:hypothetical protein